jgi:3-deoxy-D-manno-octulosonate 8-phosphate phosphatase (KDO 8-P phosphatase)
VILGSVLSTGVSPDVRVDDSLRAAIRAVRLVVFDFDGVFTDNAVWVTEDGREMVRCWRGDGLGLQALSRLGLGLLILSTEENSVVQARGRKLRVECINGCPDKLSELRRIVEQRGLRMAQVAYVGNDINDSDCLAAAGVPIVVNDAHPSVVDLARYRTRTPGGYGAVREICDLFVWVLTRGQQ